MQRQRDRYRQRQTETKTERQIQTDRETDIDRDKNRQRDRHRPTERETDRLLTRGKRGLELGLGGDLGGPDQLTLVLSRSHLLVAMAIGGQGDHDLFDGEGVVCGPRLSAQQTHTTSTTAAAAAATFILTIFNQNTTHTHIM